MGLFGRDYCTLLRGLAAEGEWEAFTCHFYNQYFAHTAGGRMIGKVMSDKLLGGRTLEFYRWDNDPKIYLLPALRVKIDAVAAAWTREQKNACISETAVSFKSVGRMLSYLKDPQS